MKLFPQNMFFSPETIEKRSLNKKDCTYFNEIYDFVRLRKVEKKK